MAHDIPSTEEVIQRIEENAAEERFDRVLNDMPMAYLEHLEAYLEWNPAAERVNPEFYANAQRTIAQARHFGYEQAFGEDVVLGIALLRNYAGTIPPQVQYHHGGAIMDADTTGYRRMRHVVTFLQGRFSIRRKKFLFNRDEPRRSESDYHTLFNRVNGLWPE